MNFARVLSLGDTYYYILRNSLQYVLSKYSGKLLAYIFMPSHIHLIIYLPAGQSISNLMRDFKKYTSTRIRQQLEMDGHEDFIEQLRRNASGRRHNFKLWMDRFDDVVIHSDYAMRTKINYIHQNPVRAGLVDEAEEWQYSSARFYSGLKDDFLQVTNWLS